MKQINNLMIKGDQEKSSVHIWKSNLRKDSQYVLEHHAEHSHQILGNEKRDLKFV